MRMSVVQRGNAHCHDAVVELRNEPLQPPDAESSEDLESAIELATAAKSLATWTRLVPEINVCFASFNSIRSIELPQAKALTSQ
jgi:hypothetical protein